MLGGGPCRGRVNHYTASVLQVRFDSTLLLILGPTLGHGMVMNLHPPLPAALRPAAPVPMPLLSKRKVRWFLQGRNPWNEPEGGKRSRRRKKGQGLGSTEPNVGQHRDARSRVFLFVGDLGACAAGPDCGRNSPVDLRDGGRRGETIGSHHPGSFDHIPCHIGSNGRCRPELARCPGAPAAESSAARCGADMPSTLFSDTRSPR